MRSLDEVVREVAGRLDLPEPVRSRTLLELRRDLEAYEAALRARGVGGWEAAERARATLVPGDQELAELARLHRPLALRLADRLGAPGHRRERWALMGLALAVTAAGAVWLVTSGALVAAGPWLWPVLGVSALVVLGGGRLLAGLYLSGAGPVGRRRLPPLPALAGLAVLLAFAGGVIELHGLAGSLHGTAGVVPGGAAGEAALVLSWLRRTSATMVVALLTAILAGAFWLAAVARIAGIERNELEAFGAIHGMRGGV